MQTEMPRMLCCIAFLAKPFDIHELIRAVGEIMGERWMKIRGEENRKKPSGHVDDEDRMVREP